MATTTITFDNKVIRQIVKALDCGVAYAHMFQMSNKNSISKAREDFLDELASQGWNFDIGGIRAPRKKPKKVINFFPETLA